MRSNTTSLPAAERRRLTTRLGKAEGIVTIAHKLARNIYGMIKSGQPYDEGTAFKVPRPARSNASKTSKNRPPAPASSSFPPHNTMACYSGGRLGYLSSSCPFPFHSRTPCQINSPMRNATKRTIARHANTQTMPSIMVSSSGR